MNAKQVFSFNLFFRSNEKTTFGISMVFHWSEFSLFAPPELITPEAPPRPGSPDCRCPSVRMAHFGPDQGNLSAQMLK